MSEVEGEWQWVTVSLRASEGHGDSEDAGVIASGVGGVVFMVAVVVMVEWSIVRMKAK